MFSNFMFRNRFLKWYNATGKRLWALKNILSANMRLFLRVSQKLLGNLFRAENCGWEGKSENKIISRHKRMWPYSDNLNIKS